MQQGRYVTLDANSPILNQELLAFKMAVHAVGESCNSSLIKEEAIKVIRSIKTDQLNRKSPFYSKEKQLYDGIVDYKMKGLKAKILDSNSSADTVEIVGKFADSMGELIKKELGKTSIEPLLVSEWDQVRWSLDLSPQELEIVKDCETRVDAAVVAAGQGNLFLVKKLEKGAPNPVEFRKEVMKLAKKMGNQEALQNLLWSDDVRNKEIVKAAQEGNLAKINELLAENPILPFYCLNESVRLAIFYNHLNVVEKLLTVTPFLETKGPKFVEFRKKLLDSAIVFSAQYGKVGLASSLLARTAISDELRSKALIQASLGGYITVMIELLNSGKVSLQCRMEAAENLKKSGMQFTEAWLSMVIRLS